MDHLGDPSGSSDSEMDRRDFVSETPAEARLAYTTPKLTVYGDVVRITEHSATMNMSDMGFMTRT